MSTGLQTERFVRLVKPFDEHGNNAEIVIGNGSLATYWVDRIPGGFLLEKQTVSPGGNPEYRVNLELMSCTCPSATFGEGPCKHTEALKALVERGKLTNN